MVKPTQTSDWASQEVDTERICNLTGFETNFFTYQGNPAILYPTYPNNTLRIAVATTPTPAQPNDWTKSDVDTTSGCFPYGAVDTGSSTVALYANNDHLCIAELQ